MSVRCPAASVDRGVARGIEIVAGLVVVVLVVGGVLASGMPERLGCEVGSAVGAVTGGSDPECDEASATSASQGATVDLLAGDSSDDPGAEDRPDAFSQGGLTGKTYSTTDSVASPATRDANAATVASARDARCALAPDRGTWDSAICLVGESDDPDEAALGSNLLLRCATEVAEPTVDSCHPTGDDDVRGHRTTLRTGPGDGDVRFCQPVRVEPTFYASASFSIGWACASWAGNLYHCVTTVAAATIGTRNPDGFFAAGVGWSVRENWVSGPGYRELWPRTCDSRTFGPTDLACAPDRATNLAACDVRGYQGLPQRPATCAWFHPHAGEQGRPTHTLNRPMHCRLVASIAADGSTSDRPTVATTGPCSAATRGTSARTGRRLQDRGSTLRSLLCRSPEPLAEGGPPIVLLPNVDELEALLEDTAQEDPIVPEQDVVLIGDVPQDAPPALVALGATLAIVQEALETLAGDDADGDDLAGEHPALVELPPVVVTGQPTGLVPLGDGFWVININVADTGDLAAVAEAIGEHVVNGMALAEGWEAEAIADGLIQLVATMILTSPSAPPASLPPLVAAPPSAVGPTTGQAANAAVVQGLGRRIVDLLIETNTLTAAGARSETASLFLDAMELEDPGTFEELGESLLRLAAERGIPAEVLRRALIRQGWIADDEVCRPRGVKRPRDEDPDGSGTGLPFVDPSFFACAISVP